MPINAPRQLSTWLKGMKTRYVPGIEVPQLWGEGEEEFGIDYPLDVVPEPGTAGPQEAADILEADVRGGAFRAPTILRGPGGEEESFNVPPSKPEPPSRQKVREIFNETYGDPDTFDPLIEKAKRMEDLDNDIRQRLGIKEGSEGLKLVSDPVKKLYGEMLKAGEKTLYTAMVDRGKRLKDALKSRMDAFDKQMEAGQQARGEAREERGLAIREAAERRAAGKPATTGEPKFDAMLTKLQSLTKKRADQEARITQMGYEYELTPSVKKARKMIDDAIAKTESFMRKRYPDLWKDYLLKAETEEKYEIGKTYTNAKGQRAEYLGNNQWRLVR